ncbi:hypothetical protein HNQ91_002378 [Filimonas zeae]|uniref:SGNH/GDSL hydrolase family protein n=1 Tax=Filimonas zeae TaxID=1737353 RepID=UPI00166AEDA2|nr:SGNH/GDSL hydrolase family protein [Filimonas zeae]MDR6339327.1 hypothetical protein [Filimonas zeae]
MKPIHLLALGSLILYAQLCSATSNADTLYASQLQPVGRTFINNNQQLALISSAAHFSFSFTGTSCTIYLAADNAGAYNYMQYEMDGVYQKRIRITGNAPAPVVITTAKTGKHTLCIYKATEAHTGALLVTKIAANGIATVKEPERPLIEFIGNSITCGAAADASEIPCGTGQYHDQHNGYMAYGPSVARALHVSYMVSGVSGIGIYRTWNRESPNMPQVYDKLDFQEQGTRTWNFATRQPAIVSIALGTNDISRGDGTPRASFDSARFVTDYIAFVKKVKAHYPQARIALLSSPMVKNAEGELLKRCIAAVKSEIDAAYPNNKPVAVFYFAPMEPHGCTGHPNVADHRIMAAQLKPFFKKLLKNNR